MHDPDTPTRMDWEARMLDEEYGRREEDREAARELLDAVRERRDARFEEWGDD